MRIAGFCLLLAAFAPASGARAQSLSPAQQSACSAHHVERWCSLLAADFSRQVVIVQPLDDLKTLGADMALRALRMTLDSQAKSALKASVDQAGQRALQAISVAGAVNQTTGAASTSASTDLAAKPTTTDFLSVAEATGGFTQTQDGSAVTLQANALGMSKYLRNQPMFVRVNQRAADWLQPLTVSVTVNLAQSGVTAVPASTSASSSIASVLLPATNTTLNSVGANYALYRRYSPQDKRFAAAWKAALLANQTALAKAGSAVARAASAMVSRVASGPGLAAMQAAAEQWSRDGSAAEHSGDFAAFAAAYERYRDAVEDLLLGSQAAGSGTDAGPQADTQTGAEAVSQLNLALEAEQEATYVVLNQARGKPLATVSYLYTTPASAPATHSATLTLAQVFQKGAQLTGDFTAEIYANPPRVVGSGRLRDVQLAAELDDPIGGTAANPRATVSVAGYGQYQYSPSVLDLNASNVAPGTTIPVSGQVLAGAAGWLGVAQGKLTLHLRQGLDIPLAVKWSNRTELLNQSDVRGQFGLSFDLAALGRLIGSS